MTSFLLAKIKALDKPTYPAPATAIFTDYLPPIQSPHKVSHSANLLMFIIATIRIYILHFALYFVNFIWLIMPNMLFIIQHLSASYTNNITTELTYVFYSSSNY